MPGLLKQCPLLRAALAPAHTIRQGQEKLLCHQRLHCLRTPWQSALGFGEGKNKLLLERIKHNFDERFGLCSYISWHLSEEQCWVVAVISEGPGALFSLSFPNFHPTSSAGAPSTPHVPLPPGHPRLQLLAHTGRSQRGDPNKELNAGGGEEGWHTRKEITAQKMRST